MNGDEFEKKVYSELKKAGFTIEREPLISGIRPDFLVHGPNGEVVVVEAKAWSSVGGNSARARGQAARYRELAGADMAYFVLPELKKNIMYEGVVNLDGLMQSLNKLFEEKVRSGGRKLKGGYSSDRTIFAAMPFDREYDDTHLVAMTAAAESVNAECVRIDQEEFSGDIVEEIKTKIIQSIAVIVDLSEAKPNVLYEAGFAHALDKPSVHICSTPFDALPFDVRNWSTIKYSKGQTVALKKKLSDRLKSVLN